MKVRITKKNDESNYWYNDRIGEVFEVEEATYPLYYRANGCYIDKDDCEIIEEESERQIINIEVWNCNTKTKFVFSTLTRITDPQQLTDVISEALNKQDDKMKEKQYVVVQDIWGIKKEDIEVCPGAPTRFIFDIESGAGALYINSKNITKFIEQGIIAEKKSKVEIIKENLIEGADKLSEQIIKNDWAKMPKAKQEDKMKEYIAVKPILDVPAEEIKVIVTDESGKFWNCYSEVKELYITSEYVLELISKGIIAEKKSKAEEITEKILCELDKSTSIVKTDKAKQIILQELEKAGVK